MTKFIYNYNNNKYMKIAAYTIIFFLLTIFLTGCSNNDMEISREKVKSEFDYLDTKLITLLNVVNGISLENYTVKSEKVNETSSSSESGGESTPKESGGSSSEGQSKQSGIEGDNEQSSNNSSGSSESSSSNSSSKAKNVRYKMEENEILLQDRTPNWQTAKSEIEKMYSTCSTIVLDLYKLNVNNQDILNFNADLDITTQYIKNEDKANALTNLAKLYSYIPKYISAISNDMKAVNLYKTKSSILTAYAAMEQGNLELVRTELSNAEQTFLPIINDIDLKTNNQSNINKSYILIKELQASSGNNDKEIFYIKYKNLIQELANIK